MTTQQNPCFCKKKKIKVESIKNSEKNLEKIFSKFGNFKFVSCFILQERKRTNLHKKSNYHQHLRDNPAIHNFIDEVKKK